MTRPQHGSWLIAVALSSTLAGCAVGQKPGGGQVLHLSEPTTGGWYWLYLPKDYDQDTTGGRTLPLVVTFHGMKPFDNAHSQIREWQQEADRYGLVVCAPELLTPDLFSPLPLNRITGSLTRDEQRVLAIMDDLAELTSIDPNTVLATSWSYGGYLAHYMANRHPHRFSCIAVKQSNFSEAILDPQKVAQYRNHKVGIFYTENDLKVCRQESEAAARWYNRHGFDVQFAVFENLGHERRPSIAASFFAQTCGATPKTSPVELARLQIKDVPLPGSATLASAAPVRPTLPAGTAPSRATGPTELVASAPSPFDDHQPGVPQRTSLETSPAADGNEPPEQTPAPPAPQTLRTKPVSTPPSQAQPTPTRPRPAEPTAIEESPLIVRLSSTIGISPLLVSYSVSGSSGLLDDAFFLWTDNGEPISNGLNGQKFLTKPGTHRLEVLVTTAQGEEYRAAQTVTVLEPVKRRGGR